MNPTYRIISGQWKAKRISAPKHFTVRPTTDFAKEALFSILDNRYALASSSVLDLFSGIGSITLEFASRGCQDIQSVEMNAKHAGFIQHTASELDLVLNMNIQRADVFDWLKKNKGKKQYDIIFADPPFDLDEKKYQELIALVLENDYLKENGVFILEHSSRMKLEHSQLLESRKYGNISFTFFNNETKEPL
ncbi:RsmD family RNA methyltransferase [Bergeyella zoohelcum]|uniref:Ribosomal RNA small subunit methyltransferase D n=1 Tax=Bergeyella zoohelcum TaxID=1015 RepID=A0A376BY65_9FLAO|nr:RsmD family RNA methyltransferase [Bergeyella zoohelcum]EKB60424.1 RsmD family RNA methyltransferase [Bergeyella zoohelcum CCUG 30536]SSZ46424.1 Ribosomal RNA small subunit methyltransferase D [Bergeyella zoohelcum]